MAHKKAGGSTSLGRDSISKRLGIKIYGGQIAAVGNVLIKQRGTKYMPGKNVKRGEDDTLYATKNGTVLYQKKLLKNFTGRLRSKTIVNII